MLFLINSKRLSKLANKNIKYKKKEFIVTERASFFLSKQGSMTLEASLVLPIFLFLFLLLMSVGNILYTHGKIYFEVSNIAKEVATNRITLPKKKDYQLFLIKNAKEEYEVRADYQLTLSMPFLPGFRQKYCQKVTQKAMTGYVPKPNELEEGYVYVTPYESVYHKDIQCSHLALKISIDYDTQKYIQGKTSYHPCEKCTKNHKGSATYFYIPEEGDAYHTDISCSGLKRTVKQVKLSTMKGRKPCQRCAQ